MYFLFTEVGRGGALASSLFCPPPFHSGESQIEKPVGSLFECQNSRRGKGSRARWLKFLPPCWLHLPNKLCFLFRTWMQHGGWGSASWQQIRGDDFQLQMETSSKCYTQKTIRPMEPANPSYCYLLMRLFHQNTASVHVIVHIRKSFSFFFFPVRQSPLGGDNLFPVELLHYGQK